MRRLPPPLPAAPGGVQAKAAGRPLGTTMTAPATRADSEPPVIGVGYQNLREGGLDGADDGRCSGREHQLAPADGLGAKVHVGFPVGGNDVRRTGSGCGDGCEGDGELGHSAEQGQCSRALTQLFGWAPEGQVREAFE